MKYAIPFLLIALTSVSIYAFGIETNPQLILEKENRERIIACLEDVYSKTGSTDMIRQIKECESIQLLSITGTLATGSTVVPGGQEKVEIAKDKLSLLHQNVCKKQINSPLCRDRELFDRLYQLTEERLPGKNFYPILLGITNAESSLGLAYAKDRVGGTCTGRNNWGGTKYKINDDNTRDFSSPKFGYDYKKKGKDDYGCYLYPFESVEEFWITKVNGMRFGYPGCINHKTPIKCLSYKYVGDPNVAEESWIRNTSIFL